MPTQEKIEALEDLKKRLDGVKTAVLAEYRGLTVRQLGELRKQLRTVSATFKVVKNRIARRAIVDSPLDPLSPHLTGPTGFVLSKQDPVAVAKALQAFTRGNQAFSVKAGFVEGHVLLPQELKALADLPSREALRSQLVGLVQGPMAQLCGLLTAPLRELVYVLEQRGQRSATTQAD